nr:hypothetical protein [Candidatus Sigynarchaeum springense]
MPVQEIRGYSLSLYHFNIQYVAGDVAKYHVLATKSFRPFLDFYIKYPQFKASCEIQGHFIAFLGRYYRDDLVKLVELVMKRKQVELVSVHYSDQIYLAYPRRDMEESIRVNDETLARYGLRRGGTFFAQENFFGPGMIPLMKEHGYKVALLNRHYLRHYQGELPAVPYYERDGVYFLPGGGFTARDKQRLGTTYDHVPEVGYDYWGDGELAFTKGSNYLPGHGPSEAKRLKRLALYINRHKSGFKTEFCTTYIDKLLELGVKPEPLPPVLDGSWNYPSYGGVYLWMGRYRLPWEKDGHIRTHTFVTRGRILAAETLLSHVKPVPWNITKALKMAWRHLLLAEVSDSTGQTPVPVEVEYSFMESGKARNAADSVIAWARGQLGIAPGAKVLVDCKAKGYQVLDDAGFRDLVWAETGKASSLADLERDVGPLNASAWNVKRGRLSVAKPPEAPKGLVEYYVYFDHVGRPSRVLSRILGIARSNGKFGYHATYDKHFSNFVGFTVPLRQDRIIASLALDETNVVDHSIGDFKIQETIGKTFLPLPNGLIGIGDGTYIIKHNLHGNTHVAATIDVRDKAVGFLQDNPPSKMRTEWKFSIVKGSRQAAIDRANEINVWPKVLV